MIAPLTAGDAIVVADTPYDVQSAAKSELRVIGVRSGGFSDRALDGAVAIYNDVKALLRENLSAFDTRAR